MLTPTHTITALKQHWNLAYYCWSSVCSINPLIRPVLRSFSGVKQQIIVRVLKYTHRVHCVLTALSFSDISRHLSHTCTLYTPYKSQKLSFSELDWCSTAQMRNVNPTRETSSTQECTIICCQGFTVNHCDWDGSQRSKSSTNITKGETLWTEYCWVLQNFTMH